MKKLKYGEKCCYDQEVTKVLLDKLNQIIMMLNGHKNDCSNVSLQTEIQQKVLYNILPDDVDYESNDYMVKTILAGYFRGFEAVGGRICRGKRL